MAVWGQGDPRWIVEERDDATNVNNWHWTEKNATGWSKTRLSDLLNGASVEDSAIGKVEITEISSINGEATANNRKAKLIFFYEFDVKLKWKGTPVEGETVTGDIEIPNLSDENSDVNDIDIEVTCKKDSVNGRKLKDLMRKQGTEMIRKKIAQYITELKTQYATDLVKPTPKDSNKPVTTGHKNANDAAAAKTDAKTEAPKPVKPTSVSTTEIEKNITFSASLSDIFDVFVNPGKVQAFTRSPSVLEPVAGGNFNLYGGNITGTFVKVESEKEIVQKWRVRSWPEGHFSTVTLSFSASDDGAVVKMVQTGVPSSEKDVTRQGWENYFWKPIQLTFGYGYDF
eukprot:Colp12_sorted_trinity150504_noHs@9202